MEQDTPVGGLELRGITKRFGSFTAVDQVDLDVRPGEIHCLLGENGAGKSTLMNVLYGLLEPDDGEIVIDGAAHVFNNPREAMAAGIGMVHQHFMLVDVFSVTENLMLGREGGALLNAASARKRVLELSSRYSMPVEPDDTITCDGSSAVPRAAARRASPSPARQRTPVTRPSR